MIHPARKMPFNELLDGLQYATQEGMVYEQVCQESGLRLYTYTDETVYDRRWNEITMMARGLIIDPFAGRVVATPFPKFFNVGETAHEGLPDLPFEVFDKLDGSLIIIFWHGGRWRCATKGSFVSEQAKWAEKWMSSTNAFRRGYTYLAEAIYPQNRIVVNYGDTCGLHLLSAYDLDGYEFPYESLLKLGSELNWSVAARRPYYNISQLLQLAKTMDANSEGWVLRFTNGLRVKIKGDEYCRIHRLIAGLTPLGVWRSMSAGDDLEVMRKQLPEEFLSDFDKIVQLISDQLNNLLSNIGKVCAPLSGWTDKEVGLQLNNFPEHIRRFIFAHRRSKGELLSDARSRRSLFEAIRPDRNILSGYRASSSMVRMQEGLKE